MVQVKHFLANYEAQIRELHSQGCSDIEIAERLQLHPQGVFRWRNKILGLPTNRPRYGPVNERIKQRNKEGVRLACLRDGISTPQERRRQYHITYCKDCGWPQVSRIREALCLWLLWDARKPLLAQDVAEYLGCCKNEAHKHLKRLQQASLILINGQTGAVYTGSKKQRYSLAPGVRPVYEEARQNFVAPAEETAAVQSA